MQTSFNLLQYCSEFFCWSVASGSVCKVTSDHNISHSVAKFGDKSVYRWLERMSCCTVVNKIRSGPIAFAFLFSKKLHDVIKTNVARNSQFLRSCSCSLGYGVKNRILTLIESISRFFLKPFCVRGGFIFPAGLPGSFTIIFQPDKSIESHADHAVPVFLGPHRLASSFVVMSPPTKFPKGLCGFIKFNSESGFRKQAFLNVIINNVGSFHGNILYNGSLSSVHCILNTVIPPNFNFGAKNSHHTKMASAYKQFGGV